MKTLILAFIISLLALPLAYGDSQPKVDFGYYGDSLCASSPQYFCIKVKPGENWQKLFPNPDQLDLVQRINRTDTYIYAGKTLAVPRQLNSLSLFDVSPFPLQIKPSDEKLIIVDQEKLAWGAYDRDGTMVKWGPISSGKDYCPDAKRVCRTITGIFYVFNKQGPKCKSNIFPVGKGGSIMPYCMFFYKGYALHGSNEVMGHRDSHGCVRLFTRDAKWLNENFIELSNAKNNFKGTKVVIQELLTPNTSINKKVKNNVEE